MSFENRNSTAPPPPPLYTIYPAGLQGNVNSGFQDCPQAPPPKYEDVISGEYLKSNYSTCNHSVHPAPTPAPNYQSVDLNGHCACSRRSQAQSEYSSEDGHRNIKCSTGCNVLFICVLISLFVWRLAFLTR